MKTVDELAADVLAMKKQAITNQKRQDEVFQELQQRVKDGESVGDLIRTYVIKIFGEIDGPMEKKLRGLDRLMGEHMGELLLVVRYKEDEGLVVKYAARERQLGIIGPMFGGEKCPTHFWLGLIRKDHLLVNAQNGSVSLPVEKFAQWKEDDWLVTDNSPPPDNEVFSAIFGVSSLFVPSAASIKLQFPYHGIETAEIHIGTKEVLACLSKEARDGKVLFYEMATAVGYPEEKMPQDVLEHVAAIKEGIRASLREHRDAIRDIVRLEKRVHAGMPVLSDSAFKKLEKHEQEVRRLLREAKSLGMALDALVIETFKKQGLVAEKLHTRT